MRFYKAIGLCAIVVCTPAMAESPFTGAWVADLDTQSGLSADIYLVADGRYSCKSCTPPRSYLADGKPHQVADDADVTSEAVTISGPRSMITHIVSPALDRTTTMTVAPDNQTATYVSIDHRPGVNVPLRTEYLARRILPTPTGAHATSGTWQGVRYVTVPAEVRTEELRVSGSKLIYHTPLGSSCTARLGGGYVPVRTADGGSYLAAFRKLAPRQIEERIQEGEKLVAIRTFTVATDGRSMEITTSHADGGSTFRITARRQPLPR